MNSWQNHGIDDAGTLSILIRDYLSLIYLVGHTKSSDFTAWAETAHGMLATRHFQAKKALRCRWRAKDYETSPPTDSFQYRAVSLASVSVDWFVVYTPFPAWVNVTNRSDTLLPHHRVAAAQWSDKEVRASTVLTV
jgi:hypothetical protein